MLNVPVLSVQDISCVGQCSLTVALPILSACGLETAILPSAVLSTHTGGFKGFTFRDLTEDVPQITAHWQAEGIRFGAVYTGYLGSIRQISLVRDIFSTLLVPGGKKLVDPAMADNGKLYSIFDMNYVEAMKDLAAESDVLLPNITEAALLTGAEYRESYDEAYVLSLMQGLKALGAKNVVLTGVSYDSDTTGVAVLEGDVFSYYRHKRCPKGCHGTGDVYASAFAGAFLGGKALPEAACIAADFTLRCIETTAPDASHWYGVRFEPLLGELIEALK